MKGLFMLYKLTFALGLCKAWPMYSRIEFAKGKHLTYSDKYMLQFL